eukprot:3714771-Lingulodinium_polyedra.AAC.1
MSDCTRDHARNDFDGEGGADCTRNHAKSEFSAVKNVVWGWRGLSRVSRGFSRDFRGTFPGSRPGPPQATRMV